MPPHRRGSGLDPHITLSNAKLQSDRLATAWAAKADVDRDQAASTLRAILDERKFSPGLSDYELVNVLELNLILAERMSLLARK